MRTTRSRLGSSAGHAQTRHRPIWVVVDQLIYSAGSLVLTALIARQATVAEFGVFSVIVTSVVLASGTARSALGEVIMLRFRRDQWSRADSDSCVAASFVAGSCALVVLLTPAVFWPEHSWLIVPLALAMPGVIVEDCLRHLYIASGRAIQAALLDLVWLLVQIAGSAAALITFDSHRHQIVGFIAAWAAVPLIVVIYLAVTSAWVRAQGWRSWFVRSHYEIRALSTDFVVTTATGLGLIWVFAGLRGAAAAGALRGAQTVYGPASTLFSGIQVASLYQALNQPLRAGQIAIRGSAAASSAAVIVMLTIALAGSELGPQLLGSTWANTARIILPFGLMRLVQCASVGLLVLDRAQARPERATRFRALSSALSFVMAVTAIMWLSVEASVWSMASGWFVGLLLWSAVVKREGGH